MRVYFGASITQGRKYLKQSRLIVKTVKQLGHQVISEYVVDPRLKIGLGLSPEKLFERETKQVGKSDLMVAEVTLPSWGTSFLMNHALKHKKPVLALYYKENNRKLSMMVRGHPDLYVESYDEDGLKSLLTHYFHFFASLKKRKGKLIVIDGADASGKTTQAKLLVKFLKDQGLGVKFIDFPRYRSSFHGQIVGRYLKGEFGKPEELNPYLTSLAYALDRLTARREISDWLETGDIVIANRYTSSSLAHQTARLPQRKRKEFLAWLYEMEYKKHKIPREDLVIFLYVPALISQRLLKKRGHKDLADKDVRHQKEALKMYLYLTRKYRHWLKIDCIVNGKMKTRKEIHREIIAVLRERGIIK
jgi:dTMP kinase